MAWNDKPPTKEELKSTSSWADTPPTPEELGQAPQISELQSGAEGAAVGATMGAKPALAGSAQTLMNVLTGITSPSDALEQYRSIRDQEKTNQKQAQEANPKSYLAGELVGGALPATLMPQAAGVKGAAALGAATGAITGANTSEADLTKGEVGDFAKDVGKNALIGGVTGGAFQGLLNRLNPAAEALESSANQSALNAVGTTKSDIKKLVGKDKIDELGELLRKPTSVFDKPIVTGLANSETMLERANNIKDLAGQKIGQTLDTLDNYINEPGIKDKFLNPSDVASKIENEVLNPIKGEQLYTTEANQVQKLVNDILRRGNNPISFSEAQDLKNKLSKVFQKNSDELSTQMQQQSASIFGKEMENAADNVAQAVGNPDLLKQYTDAKKAFRVGSIASESLPGKVASDIKNNTLGLGDLTLGVGGAVIGGAGGHGLGASLTGAGAVVASKLAKKYGSQSAAQIKGSSAELFRGINQALTSTPEAITSIGSSLAKSNNPVQAKLGRVLTEGAKNVSDEIGRNALIFSLMQNPSYREIMKNLLTSKKDGSVK